MFGQLQALRVLGMVAQGEREGKICAPWYHTRMIAYLEDWIGNTASQCFRMVWSDAQGMGIRHRTLVLLLVGCWLLNGGLKEKAS